MARPYAIRILMLEDKPEYQGSFEALASKERIIVNTVDNAEDLIIRLRTAPRLYKFIVLDAKAFFTEGEKQGSESEANLIYIFRELKNIESESGVIFKYAINTGFADIKLSHGKLVDCPIFEKGNEDILFNYIWSEHDKDSEAFVKKHYPELIPLYDSFFTEKVQEKTISLFNNDYYKNPSLGARLDNLSSLRMINEQIMDILLQQLHGKIWNEIHDKIGSRSRAIAEYLESYKDISYALKEQSVNIYKTASKYGEHSEAEVINDPDFPTHRMVGALALALLELFQTSNRILNL